MKVFEDDYKRMYNLKHGGEELAGYAEAVKAFDDFLFTDGDFVRDFIAYRGDFISSDREAAAFMFALSGVAVMP